MKIDQPLKPISLVVSSATNAAAIRINIEHLFDVIEITPEHDCLRLLQSHQLSSMVIAYQDEDGSRYLQHAITSRTSFPGVPVIVIMFDSNLEAVRTFGEMSVQTVIPKIQLPSLNKIISQSISQFSVNVSLKDFNIDPMLFPLTLRQAMEYIEGHYLRLMNTKHVAEYVGITESSLARKFKESDVLSPKKLLMYFKVKHAIKLMRNDGMSLKTISYLSGFSNEKRFNECFHRVFECGPDSFRKYYLGVREVTQMKMLKNRNTSQISGLDVA